MLESNTGKDIAKVKTWLMQSRFRAAMQVNQHKPCGSLSHCDRTGEREKNALPAIRVVLPDRWYCSPLPVSPRAGLFHRFKQAC